MRRQNKNAGRTTSGLIDVGATKLYHEVAGSGPVLLLITGGTGDAGEWAQVASTLAKEFTVVTYDRRGFSRSPRPDGWGASNAAEQADDAAALLRALDLAPAVVVGHSAGASVACQLVVDHPEMVRQAVLYEPPLMAVVPDGQQIVAGMRAAVEPAMAEGGPRAAMEVFMRGNAGDEVFDQWFALAEPAERDRVLDNGAVLFPIELPWLATFVPDRDRMRASGVPLTVVAGADNRDTWFGAATTWLAEGIGVDPVELPGGHAGYVTHAREFVALVRRCHPDRTALAPGRRA
jgi:pimeloyl-ACP methyl ester carboxylesterase